MEKTTRRIRSPHPGVVLKQRTLPSGYKIWRARYVDPDTRRTKYKTLDRTALSNAEARRVWAIQKSRELAKRRMDIESGAMPFSTKSTEDALKEYLDGCKNRVRKHTVTHYTFSCKQFGAWCSAESIDIVSKLTSGDLARFREYVIGLRRRTSVKEGDRGERREAKQRLSPNSVNMRLNAVKVMLNQWRRIGLVGRISRDDITDSLRLLQVPRDEPEILRTAQLQKLLESALAHDSERFKMTREEHAKPLTLTKGTTFRYEPIAPFVVCVLLSGMRRIENLNLSWPDVDLDALDHERRKVGEIRLKASATKTKQGRTIGLEVSPALHRLLSAMKLRAAQQPYVFGGKNPYTVDFVESTRERLIKEYGAPAFSWQALRATCSTFLTNAPGIWGAATVFLSARQLGHSVAVAEKHYLGVHRGISRDARSLDEAMGITKILNAIINEVATRPSEAVAEKLEAG